MHYQLLLDLPCTKTNGSSLKCRMRPMCSPTLGAQRFFSSRPISSFSDVTASPQKNFCIAFFSPSMGRTPRPWCHNSACGKTGPTNQYMTSVSNTACHLPDRSAFRNFWRNLPRSRASSEKSASMLRRDNMRVWFRQILFTKNHTSHVRNPAWTSHSNHYGRGSDDPERNA